MGSASCGCCEPAALTQWCAPPPAWGCPPAPGRGAGRREARLGTVLEPPRSSRFCLQEPSRFQRRTALSLLQTQPGHLQSGQGAQHPPDPGCQALSLSPPHPAHGATGIRGLPSATSQPGTLGPAARLTSIPRGPDPSGTSGTSPHPERRCAGWRPRCRPFLGPCVAGPETRHFQQPCWCCWPETTLRGVRVWGTPPS